MAFRALTLQGGQFKQITDLQFLSPGGGLDPMAAGTLVVGDSNTTSLNLAVHPNTTSANLATGTGLASLNIGTGVSVKTITIGSGLTGGVDLATIQLNGNVEITGTETVQGNTVFNEDIQLGDADDDRIWMLGRWGTAANPDFIFSNDANHGIAVSPRAATLAGRNLGITSGDGGVATAGGAGGTGGQLNLVAGYGGNALAANNPGGTGGAMNLRGGAGGAGAGNQNPGPGGASDLMGGYGGPGTGTQTSGSGGNLYLTGGSAGATGGAGLGAAGDVYIRGGTGVASGDIFVGDSSTTSITIGSNTCDLTLNTDAFDLQLGGTSILQGSGTTLTLQAAGSFDMWQGAQVSLPLQFWIDDPSVPANQTSINVTAANLNILTAGPASDADALHTHAGLASGSVDVSIDTTTNSITTGLFGYQDATADQADLTDADAFASSLCFGANVGTADYLRVCGTVAAAAFTTAGGSPNNGDPVYLAPGSEEANAAGKLTATVPSTATQWVARVGICMDNSLYAGAKTCKILLQVMPPVEIN